MAKNKKINFEELKKLAIPVKSSIRIGDVTVKPNPKYHNFYCTDTSALAFVVKKTLYLIPYHSEFKKILDEEGFLQESMFVPLIDNYSLNGHIAEWQSLRGIITTGKVFNQ